MATFTFELVSPERILFSGAASSVVVPASEGEMTVLAGHAPLVSTLKAGVVSVKGDGGTGKEYFVNGGLLEINPAGATILAEQGRAIEEVDAALLDREVAAAEARLAGTKDEAEAKRLTESLAQLRDFKSLFATRRAA